MTAAPTRAPQPGDLLAGRYRLERVLGRGGMGVVFAATQTDLDRPVAVKVLADATLASPDTQARFVREARATAGLESPHVVRVLDAGTTDLGLSFLVMERLEGIDLARAVALLGPLPIGDAVRCVQDALHGIGEAHAHGVVHRDLKPSNLFLARRFDGQERVVVLDFGIAKAATTLDGANLTATTDAVGSPLYMSPEQIRSAKAVDPRTDIWALGAILYELLAGVSAFEAPSLTALAVVIATEAPRPLRERRPDVPEELCAVVVRCLEKRPEDRFATTAELERALEPFATEGKLELLARVGEQAADLPPSSRAATLPGPATPRRPPSAPREQETTVPGPRAALGSRRAVVLGAATLALGVAAVAMPPRQRDAGRAAPGADAAPRPASGPCRITGRAPLAPSHGPYGFAQGSSLAAGRSRALFARFNRGTAAVVPTLVPLVEPLAPPLVEQPAVLPLEIGTTDLRIVALALRGEPGVLLVTAPAPLREDETACRAMFMPVDAAFKLGMPQAARVLWQSVKVFAGAATGDQVVAVTVGENGRGVAPRPIEVRAVQLLAPAAEETIFRVAPSEPAAASPTSLRVAGGAGRAVAVFTSGGKVHASFVSPAPATAAEPVSSTGSQSANVVVRDDEVAIMWLDGSGALHLRTAPPKSRQLGPDVTLPVGPVLAYAVGAFADQVLLVWTSAADRRSYYVLRRSPLGELASTDARGLDLDGTVADVALGERAAWVVYGQPVPSALTLACDTP